MFDANGYPFPPKPVPLDVAATLYYHKRIKTLIKKHNAVMVPHLLYRPVNSDTDGRNWRLCVEFAGDSTIWQRASSFDAISLWGEFDGGNCQDPQPGKRC